MYICPLCYQTLQLSGRQFQCASRHSFDLAKEGYVNLLPVQHKNSKDPGDNKQMIGARREFLQSGAYQPLSDAINAQVANAVATSTSSILDLGCGEGYYSGRLQQALTPGAELYGIDISKAAVKYAARQYADIRFAVASAYQLPFADNSFDWVIRVYAPSDSTELQRVIKPQGRLLSVNPGPNHLIEMKQAVYSEVKLHSDDIKEQPGFTHIQRQRLSYPLTITDATQLDNLLQMVPLAWKFTSENRQAFVKATGSISIDFLLDVYQLND
ncbi:23S rRNA (guanine(745)-N(1))-methyltransferase [Arsukibacterium sp.]|uniref:23S rRNA (guanine(745)-N(1))-methyltransferase n=1 Tax=Arsukibacterium sp. TaxID=1977258 RepID=UPI003568C9F3